MKPKSSRVLGFAVALAFFAVSQPQPAHAEVIEAVNQYYLIEAVYDKKLAYPGTKNLVLTVTMKTSPDRPVPADKVLTFAKYDPPDDSNIAITLDSQEHKTTPDGYEAEIYSFRITIPEKTEARTYKLRFKFQYPDPKTPSVDRRFDLNVGVWTKDYLEVTGLRTEPFIAGSSDAGYTLNLRNKYPDYTINIHKITINSVPERFIQKIEVPGLDETKPEVNDRTRTISFKPALSIKPFQQQPVQLNLALANMSATNWLFGFSDGSNLSFDIDYDDSNERSVSGAHTEAPVRIKPGEFTLLGVMFVGVVIGTFIKFYLEYLRESGVLDKRGVAVFVTITLLVGVVISIIAWAGQIQIVAFNKLNLSYDKPVAIFTIGLVGALAGVHYLNNWAQKLFSPTKT